MAHILTLPPIQYLREINFPGFWDRQLYLANIEYLNGFVASLFPIIWNEPSNFHVSQEQEILFKSPLGRAVVVGRNAIKSIV